MPSHRNWRTVPPQRSQQRRLVINQQLQQNLLSVSPLQLCWRSIKQTRNRKPISWLYRLRIKKFWNRRSKWNHHYQSLPSLTRPQLRNRWIVHTPKPRPKGHLIIIDHPSEFMRQLWQLLRRQQQLIPLIKVDSFFYSYFKIIVVCFRRGNSFKLLFSDNALIWLNSSNFFVKYIFLVIWKNKHTHLK